MRNSQGWLIGFDPDGGVKEYDTFTCSHCQRIVIVKAKCDPAEMGGLCKICDKLICKECVGKGCSPWEEKMKEM